MNKSILVIDTPKSCKECKYRSNSWIDGYSTCLACGLDVKKYLENETKNYTDKYGYNGKLKIKEKYLNLPTTHPQCPLQDTTELLEALDYIKIITKDKNKIKSYYKLYNALGGKQ